MNCNRNEWTTGSSWSLLLFLSINISRLIRGWSSAAVWTEHRTQEYVSRVISRNLAKESKFGGDI